MWRNYLTVAVRALAKSRTYSIINIAGLAIGMAACLLILLFIRYETSYDRWLPGVADTYQFQAWYPKPRDGEPTLMQMSSYVTTAALKKDFPEVENTVYALGSSPTFVKDGQVSTTEDYLYVDGDFLDVVRLPLIAGDMTALRRPDSAVLTRAEAVKRLGTGDVVGRTITLISKGEPRDFRVTAVARDLPTNSSLKVSAIIRRDFPALFAREASFLRCWSCQSGWVFARLKPGTDAAALNARMPAWEKRNIPDETGEVRYNAGDDEDWHLVNLRDVHLGLAQNGAMRPGNDWRSIATFAIVALLILGMAVVNFTNLATARASQRAREVALRKVLGASRRQLVVQFLAESILFATIAMLIALALVELFLPLFSAFLDADIPMRYLGREGVLPAALLLTLAVGLVGGLYPAFFLSRFQPAAVLKANRSASETPGSGRVRTILVVGQFAVSIGLIACTAIIYSQTAHARSVDPGYQRDHILQVDNMSRYQLIPLGETIADQVRRVPGVKAVGRTDIGVATGNTSNTGVLLPGSTKQVNLGTYKVDRGFRDAMGLTLLAGRWFDERPTDDTTVPFPSDPRAEDALARRGINVVVNEYAVRKLGFRDPATAVGKKVRGGLFPDSEVTADINIIGVVKDSRFRSVRAPIDPIMFWNVRIGPSNMIVRYDGDPAAVRSRVEAVWKQVARDVPFEAKFSDDIMIELYEAEDARARIFAAFSLLAVVIGCLGLFGLAAFTAERRTKEIGIRKVLGARTRDIVRLLVWQFSRPVAIANLIAWPVAWWLMRDWLNGFDDRIALGPVPFLLAGALALGIAVATVAGHAVRIARANPIHALRYE